MRTSRRTPAEEPASAAGVVSLGRVAGVPVDAHWSVLGIVGLVAVVMARAELPLLAPGRGSVAYVAAGLAVAVLLVVSLLAHEAAHALVARGSGLGVEGITLWLLGGTTRLRGDPDRPDVEFRVAVVGPLTSAALAGLFGLTAVLVGTANTGLTAAVLLELAVINLALAVFNLLPAAPLDGGRVLRAALWAVRHDRWGAGIGAARTGQGLAALLVGLGVLAAVTGNLGGLWLVLLGWFIGGAAGDEERRARLGRALQGVPVGAVAAPAPLVLPPTAGVADVAAAADAARAGGVLLRGHDGHLVGYLPPDRLPRLFVAVDDARALRRLAVSPARLTPVAPDDALDSLLGRLAEPDSRLVVLDDDTPVGTVSAAEVDRVTTSAGPPTAGAVRPADVPAPDAPPPPGWSWPGGPVPGADGVPHQRDRT